MKKILAILAAIILIASCMPESQNKHLTYQNIAIISDMSSRIRNMQFPQKDTKEIHNIVQYFKNECVKPGEKIGDKSSISFSAFSEKNITSIDLDKIKDLGDKQSFINSTGKYQLCGLTQKLEEFEDSIKIKYRTSSDFGLDLL
ncbi:MAG: hypothetical protein EOP00_31390, partial [Pedobacter sp.]